MSELTLPSALWNWQTLKEQLYKIKTLTSRQLSELKTVGFRATLKKKNIISSLFGSNFRCYCFYCESYTQPIENTINKTLSNLGCQIEDFFIVESFVIGKIWNL